MTETLKSNFFNQTDWSSLKTTLSDNEQYLKNINFIKSLCSVASDVEYIDNDDGKHIPKKYTIKGIEVKYLPHWRNYSVGGFTYDLPDLNENTETNLNEVMETIDTVKNTGKSINIGEFKDFSENTVWFHQGASKISSSGKSLHSDGFSECTAFIIQRTDGLEAYGAHIDELSLNRQQEEMAYSLPPGKYVGRFIRGTISRDIKENISKNWEFMENFCKQREISFLPDIKIDSENYHWALIYKPESHLLRLHVSQSLQFKSDLSQTVKEVDFFKKTNK